MKDDDIYLKLYKIADYVGYLSLVSIERSKSGHPGLPLGMRHLLTLLYAKHMNASSKDPHCFGRDKFVLSAGHGSAVLYSLNYVFGYDFDVKDLANFRQMHSKTPGHPEYDIDLGIETTTGPLGQGIANAVGMAMESKMLGARFNNSSYSPFNNRVYCVVGDGCLMEGISYESSSIAGHLGLDNLCVVYDSNSISIDGNTDITFTEDVKKRFESQNWVVREVDGHDIQGIDRELNELKAVEGKPQLLIAKTTIGKGLDKKSGQKEVHGSPVGLDELFYYIKNSNIKDDIDVKKIKDLEISIESGQFLSKTFLEEDLKLFNNRRDHFIGDWNHQWNDYKQKNPELLQKFVFQGVPNDLKDDLLSFESSKNSGRDLISEVLQLVASRMENVVGGSADLVGSTKATIKSSQYVVKNDFIGRNIAYGVREHAMAAIGNGLALSHFFLPFSSTFFSFFDYMKNALRLSSMMKLKHLFIFTHDSILVGEDGPTHQPIEHLMGLRSIPNIRVFRVANAMEASMGMLYYLENNEVVVLIGSRASMRQFKVPDKQLVYDDFKKGAYVVYQDENPDVCLLATGSEVGDVLEVSNKLRERGIRSRVVSISSMELFSKNESFHKNLLLKNGKNFIFELGSYFPYSVFFAENIYVKDISQFGYSSKVQDLKEYLGLNIGDYLAFIDEKL